MAEQSAVEWLENEINSRGPKENNPPKWLKELYQKAKEMDKQQKIDAYSHGWHDGQDVIISQVKHIDKGGDDAGEKFYNETFKK